MIPITEILLLYVLSLVNFVRVLMGLFSSGFPARMGKGYECVGRWFRERQFKAVFGLFCYSPLHRQSRSVLCLYKREGGLVTEHNRRRPPDLETFIYIIDNGYV
jgi:hypothetical protein